MTELKPCPFCGSTYLQVVGSSGDDESYSVECWGCDASGGSCATKEAAIDEWNRRVSE